MQTTLRLYLCVQFLHTASCLLPVCILSHSEVLALQFYHTYTVAVSDVVRLWCSDGRHPSWPGALDTEFATYTCDIIKQTLYQQCGCKMADV